MMIEARGLVRTFKTKRGPVNAVQGVDLDVADGEIVGFLGPNGAGKTTTMRMLATLIKPTSGTATVAGCDLAKDPVGVRRRIGYVPQSGSTLPEAIAGDEVVTHARLYGVSKTTAAERGTKITSSLPGATDAEVDGAAVTFRVPRGGAILPGLLRSIDAQSIELE